MPVLERGDVNESGDSRPRDEVAVSVYPLEALPTRRLPYAGVDERPVPPRFTAKVPVVSESAMPREDVASC